MAWSPDGASVASGSDDNTVRLWDAASGRERHRLEGHSRRVRSVAWSPDGANVASGSDDNTVRLWDAASGRERHRLEGHSNEVRSVAWSPDGASVASGSNDKTVRLWDAASGHERLSLEGHQSAIELLAWSPDSRTLASVSQDGEIRLWNAVTGQLLDRRIRCRFTRLRQVFRSAQRGQVGKQALTMIVWRPAAALPAAAAQVLQASAKVILAGDSDAGKTCLARRLAEDAYEERSEFHSWHASLDARPREASPERCCASRSKPRNLRLGSRRPE